MHYLQAHPDKARYTFEYMAAHKQASPTWLNGSVPVDDFKLSEREVEEGRVMVVDVGGGSGKKLLGINPFEKSADYT